MDACHRGMGGGRARHRYSASAAAQSGSWQWWARLVLSTALARQAEVVGLPPRATIAPEAQGGVRRRRYYTWARCRDRAGGTGEAVVAAAAAQLSPLGLSGSQH
jgi:hypothetical protein